MKHVVIAPHRMPLGDYIYRMPWRVEAIAADRLTVFCPQGRRVLFPSATDFLDTPEAYSEVTRQKLVQRALAAWPDAEHLVFRNGAAERRPVISPGPIPLPVDVVIGPRFKLDEKTYCRNWPGWGELCSSLQARNLSVVASGSRRFSYELPCEYAETVNAMASHMAGCRLVVATDSASAHLAILLGKPVAVIWGSPVGVIPGQTYAQGCHAVMERQKHAPVYHLAGAWQDVGLALSRVLDLL